MCLGPAQVHAQDHVGPVLGLGAAGTRLDVEVGVVFVHLAREHAPEFEAGKALLESCKIVLDFGDGVGVFFLGRELEQVAGVIETRRQVINRRDDVFERRALLAQRLGALGFVPDIRLFEFALNFGQALRLGVVVKDTP
jgi:hypothetical protein